MLVATTCGRFLKSVFVEIPKSNADEDVHQNEAQRHYAQHYIRLQKHVPSCEIYCACKYIEQKPYNWLMRLRASHGEGDHLPQGHHHLRHVHDVLHHFTECHQKSQQGISDNARKAIYSA